MKYSLKCYLLQRVVHVSLVSLTSLSTIYILSSEVSICSLIQGSQKLETSSLSVSLRAREAASLLDFLERRCLVSAVVTDSQTPTTMLVTIVFVWPALLLSETTGRVLRWQLTFKWNQRVPMSG
jgi:hypothetical protein